MDLHNKILQQKMTIFRKNKEIIELKVEIEELKEELNKKKIVRFNLPRQDSESDLNKFDCSDYQIIGIYLLIIITFGILFL